MQWANAIVLGVSRTNCWGEGGERDFLKLRAQLFIY